MKLKTKQLLDFHKLSSIVQSNSIIPIHNYIRLQGGTLAKTNGRIFICQTIDAPADVSLLLEEDAIMPFAKFTNDDEIELRLVNVNGSDKIEVVMIDGSREGKFQSPPLKDFDNIPQFVDDENAVDFDSDVLQAIGIARNCAADIGGGANFDFIFLNDNYIFATDKNKLYTKKIDGIPNAYFDKECAMVISQFNSMKFRQSDKYNLFQSGGILYGFQQFGDVKPPNIKSFLRTPQGDFFEFEASDLINYCEWVNASVKLNAKEVAECDIVGAELNCVKSEYGKQFKEIIKFNGDFKPNLRFNPKLLAPYIRSLGATTLRFYEFGDVGFYITDIDDKDMLGMIAGLFRNQ